MQLTSRQSRLEHVARIHGPFRLASAHHGVQLINEHNGLTFIFGQLVQDRFKALFKLTAKLCAGKQGGHVQRKNTLAFQGVGHFTGHDALRQAFNNGSLANAWLTNQHWIVFGPTLQHLNGSSNFVVSANDRVEFAHSRTLREVEAIFFQGLALSFGFCTVHVLSSTHCFYSSF